MRVLCAGIVCGRCVRVLCVGVVCGWCVWVVCVGGVCGHCVCSNHVCEYIYPHNIHY